MNLNDVFFDITLTCNICGKEINGGYFCKECQNSLPYNNVICNRCGRSTINAENVCNSCENRDVFFDKARSVFKYLPPISQCIKQLKYNGKRYYAKIFAPLISYYLLNDFADTDLLINVPMHKVNLFVRGYNQTELIAKEVSKLSNIEFNSNVFVKTIKTKRQAKLSREERKKNLKNAFTLTNKNLVKDKVVTIIDDVMTTGSTMETLAEKLIKAKAKKVYIVTIASVGEREFVEREKIKKPWYKRLLDKIISKFKKKKTTV